MDEYVSSKLEEWNMTSLQGVFEKHQIDQEALLLLDRSTVRELVEAIGPRTKLWKRIQELQKEQENFQQQLCNSLWPIPVSDHSSQYPQPIIEYSLGNPVNTVVVHTESEGVSIATSDTPKSDPPNSDPPNSDTPTGDQPHGAVKGDGYFLPADRLWLFMMTGEPSGRAVPDGRKENVYFLLQSEEDIHSARYNMKAFYLDDLIPWEKISVKMHHYIVNGESLHHVGFKDGLFCKLLKGEEPIPLNPQPAEESVLVYQRSYMLQKHDKASRKRISTVVRCPEHMARLKKLAVVEYARMCPREVRRKGPPNIPTDNTPIPSAFKGDGHFLSAQEMWEIMMTREPSGKTVPPGVKEGVYFLLMDKQNIDSGRVIAKSFYVDDYAPWTNCSGKTHMYVLVDEKLHYVELRDGVYCKFERGRGHTPHDPQPDENSLLVFKRSYMSLQQDGTFRKRISVVFKCPESMARIKDMGVVEYARVCPKRKVEELPTDDALIPDAPILDAPIPGAPIPGAIEGNGSFLCMDEILQIMLTFEPSGTIVPPGVKENVCFLLNNEENMHRQQNNKAARYIDDCGAWGRKGSTKLHHYIVDGEGVRFITFKDDIFWNGAGSTPLDPQPEEGNILKVRRYYQRLKRDKNYRKRISTVLECPGHLAKVMPLAVVEYVGTYPKQNLPHGNAKPSSKAYVRRTPRVKKRREDSCHNTDCNSTERS